MKFPILLFLLHPFAKHHLPDNQKNIPVQVVVESTDNRVKDRIISEFQTALRAKSKIDIVNSNPTFVINATTALTKSQNGNVVHIALSTVLAKKTVLKDDQVDFIVQRNISSHIEIEEIKTKCEEIVASFDVHYFEKERGKLKQQ